MPRAKRHGVFKVNAMLDVFENELIKNYQT